jgi:hypothetical protein
VEETEGGITRGTTHLVLLFSLNHLRCCHELYMYFEYGECGSSCSLFVSSAGKI